MRWLEEQKVGYNIVSNGTILWCGEEVVIYDVGLYAYDAVCERALYNRLGSRVPRECIHRVGAIVVWY
jgi:hypothetical protein